MITGNIESKIFTVTVDHSRSLEEMVRAGNYKKVSSTVNKENFPVKGSGRDAVKLRLVRLKITSLEDVREQLEKQGLRPATPPELLAFGEAYPEYQLDYIIFSYDSVVVGPSAMTLALADFTGDDVFISDCQSYVLSLNNWGGERALGLLWVGCAAVSEGWLLVAYK